MQRKNLFFRKCNHQFYCGLKAYNMRRIFLIQVVLLLSAYLNSDLSAQHKIRISMPSFAKDTLILGHYFRESLIIQDSAILDSKGNGEFSGTKKLPSGLYLVYLPNKGRFDLLIDKNQTFSIEADSSDLTRKTKITGDTDNILFYQYQSFIADQRDYATRLQKNLFKASKQDSVIIKKQIEDVNNQVFDYVKNLVDSNTGSFISKFLISLKEVDVPDFPRDSNGNITD